MVLSTVVTGLLLWVGASAAALAIYAFASSIGYRRGYADGYAAAEDAMRRRHELEQRAQRRARRSA